MTVNSWMAGEVVLVFFIGMEVNSLVNS